MKYCCVINNSWLICASLFHILPPSKLVPLYKKSCIVKVLPLGFTSPCLFLCLFVLFVLFWGFPLIDITCVFLFVLIFLSSHAFTVSFGICQHLPSGENSLQVAECVCVCVCVQKLIMEKKLTQVVVTALRSGWSGGSWGSLWSVMSGCHFLLLLPWHSSDEKWQMIREIWARFSSLVTAGRAEWFGFPLKCSLC